MGYGNAAGGLEYVSEGECIGLRGDAGVDGVLGLCGLGGRGQSTGQAVRAGQRATHHGGRELGLEGGHGLWGGAPGGHSLVVGHDGGHCRAGRRRLVGGRGILEGHHGCCRLGGDLAHGIGGGRGLRGQWGNLNLQRGRHGSITQAGPGTSPHSPCPETEAAAALTAGPAAAAAAVWRWPPPV